MTSLNHNITINSPKETVFQVLSDLEKVQEYNPMVLSAYYISDTHHAIGASRECQLAGNDIVREKIIDYKKNHYITMELYEHNWPLFFMKWKTELLRIDEKTTQLSQTLEYKMKFGLIGTILDRLVMRKKLDKTLQETFISMKKYIENAA